MPLNEHTSLIDDISDEDYDSFDDTRAESTRMTPTTSSNTNTTQDEYDQKELNNYEEALRRIGFGKFHYLVLLVCGLANASDAVEILCVSFILPAAECDLNMSTADKGILNSMTFLGMMIGGFVWGGVSDFLGRKYVLISALLFNAFFAVLAGMSQSFGTLLFFRLMSGLGIGGSIPIVWSYFTEFMPKHIRGRMMCCLAFSWVFGNLLVVLLAFLVLRQTDINIHFITSSILINNWRLFMILCAFPSIISAILLFFLPESPKFYLYNLRNTDAQKVLQYVYLFNNKVNTTQTIDAKWRTFKFFEKLKHRPILSTLGVGRDRTRTSDATRSYCEKLTFHSSNIVKQTLSLFKQPYTFNTILVLCIMFSLCFGYYGLWMWLPELFKRMTLYGGTPCSVTGLNVTLVEQRRCVIEDSVYMSSLISALSNIPGNIFTIVFIDKFGRNIITISSLVLSGVCVFCISLVTTQTQGVVLTTIFGGIITMTFNSFSCTCAELYPTTLRSTAIGLQYVAGRTGAILGNLLFGFAVDVSCYIPLFTISAVLILSGLIAVKLPESSKADIH